MKLIKDKELFKVSKEETKLVKGIKNTRAALKLAQIDKPLFSLIIFFFIVSVAGSVINALLSKEVLSVFTNGNYEKLFTYAFIILGLWALIYINDYAQGYYYQLLKNKMTLSIKIKLYDRINEMKASCFTNNQTSTFTQRLGESTNIVGTFDIIFNTIQSIANSLAYCIVLLIYSPILFSISATFYLVKSILYKFVIPKHNVIRRRTRKVTDEAKNIAMETIRGANDIKSLNMAHTLQESYVEKNDKYYSQLLSIGVWWRNRIMPVNYFSYEINFFVFMLLVIYFGINQTIESAILLYFWSYRGNINVLFNNLFNIKEKFSDIEVSASRMMELYDEEKYPVEKFGDKTIKNFVGNIEFKNVSFQYEKDNAVLDNVSFKVEANKITAFVGKTGCGKSTTLSLIAKFQEANKGRILIDGKSIKTLTKDTIRNNIGYVQQNPYIFNRTFKENLLLVKPDATDEEIMDACKKSEIHDFIMTTKDKYDTLLGENGINLSGGQRQRFAIARALLNNSKIIMFDESTSALDNENQSKIQAVIENLSKDHTIIVVAHRLSTIINADKIIFIEDHKIKAEGTHKELFENCKEYRNFMKSKIHQIRQEKSCLFYLKRNVALFIDFFLNL